MRMGIAALNKKHKQKPHSRRLTNYDRIHYDIIAFARKMWINKVYVMIMNVITHLQGSRI